MLFGGFQLLLRVPELTRLFLQVGNQSVELGVESVLHLVAHVAHGIRRRGDVGLPFAYKVQGFFQNGGDGGLLLKFGAGKGHQRSRFLPRELPQVDHPVGHGGEIVDLCPALPIIDVNTGVAALRQGLGIALGLQLGGGDLRAEGLGADGTQLVRQASQIRPLRHLGIDPAEKLVEFPQQVVHRIDVIPDVRLDLRGKLLPGLGVVLVEEPVQGFVRDRGEVLHLLPDVGQILLIPGLPVRQLHGSHDRGELILFRRPGGVGDVTDPVLRRDRARSKGHFPLIRAGLLAAEELETVEIGLVRTVEIEPYVFRVRRLRVDKAEGEMIGHRSFEGSVRIGVFDCPVGSGKVQFFSVCARIPQIVGHTHIMVNF